MRFKFANAFSVSGAPFTDRASLLTDTNETLTHSGAGAQSDLLNIGEW